MINLEDLENIPSPASTVKEDDGLVVHGRYHIPDPETGVMRRWTRASTFAKSITDNYMLGLWKERMVAMGLAMRPDLMRRLKTLLDHPNPDREAIQKICHQAKEAAGASKGANNGTFVHKLCEDADKGEFPTLPDEFRDDVHAYLGTMKTHNFYAIPEHIEKVIVCPRLGCAGRLDRILRVVGTGVHVWEPGTLLIGDIKTAKNLGYSWLEVAIQLAIYANATHTYDPRTGEFSPMVPVDLDTAIVMSIPVGSGECQLYAVDIAAGMELAELSLLVRKSRNRKNLAVRLARPNPLTVAPITKGVDWRARLGEAKCRADLSAVWEEAEARGEWTPELEAYGLNIARELRG